MIAAVLDLAADGGYEAIQVRAIAERTGISSDTIYRYFGSRDRLIAAAVGQCRATTSSTSLRPPGSTARPPPSSSAYYRQVWSGVGGLIPACSRPTCGRPGSRRRAQWDRRLTRVSSLVPVTEYALRDVEPEYRDDTLTAVRHFTHSAMTYVVRGQMSVDDVYPELERLVRRLAQHPAMADHRPRSWDWVPGAPG